MTITLRGWKALIPLVAFVAWIAFNYQRVHATLDTKAMESLRPWIVGHYTSAAMADTNGKSFDQMTGEEREAYSRKIANAGKVEIKSIQARGTGNNVICRVEVLVDGKPPPDGKSVRYFRMSYSNLIGWTYRYETSELIWRLTLW